MPEIPDASLDGQSWEDRATHLADGDVARSVDFNFAVVEDPVDVLREQLGEVKLSYPQAAAVLRFVREHFAPPTTPHPAAETSLVIARVIGEMIASDHVRLDAYSVAIAAGLDQTLGIGSEADVGRRLKVTRANVSKCVGKWRDVLGYAVTKFTRSDANRRNCAAAQSGPNHWRRRKPDASQKHQRTG